jgi:hypothetical protein
VKRKSRIKRNIVMAVRVVQVVECLLPGKHKAEFKSQNCQQKENKRFSIPPLLLAEWNTSQKLSPYPTQNVPQSMGLKAIKLLENLRFYIL